MIDQPHIIELPKIMDQRGNLSFIEKGLSISFKIQRVYWVYDVPGDETRGGHAFKEQKEIIVALSGSFNVIIKNKSEEKNIHLRRSYYGLYIPNGYWRHIENFSTNSLALVLSSTFFDKNDYIRDFDEYLRWLDEKQKHI